MTEAKLISDKDQIKEEMSEKSFSRASINKRMRSELDNKSFMNVQEGPIALIQLQRPLLGTKASYSSNA